MRTSFDRPPSGMCVNCGQRPATSWWAGKASFFEVNHGAPVHAWCKVCVAEAQLEAAKVEAARIPKLEAELAELRRGDG